MINERHAGEFKKIVWRMGLAIECWMSIQGSWGGGGGGGGEREEIYK